MSRNAPVRTFDLTTRWGRFKAHVDFFFHDYAFFRVLHPNAYWLGDRAVRSSQPWPFQLKRWRDKGIRTVLHLRGEEHTSHFALEADACKRLGLRLETIRLWSRGVPSRAEVHGMKRLFDTADYPILIHCKSGADRAGMMAVLYRHWMLGEPLRDALSELSFRRGHVKAGMTGAIDYFFERYLAEGEPAGLTLLQWVDRPEFDESAIKADFRANWWGKLLTDRILRRE